MSIDERELELHGEHFIAAFEAIRRALALYPPSHPNVAAQMRRFMENLAELRRKTGDSNINLAKGEFFVNGVPLKRLSLTYAKAIEAWEEKGIGLISFGSEMNTDSMSQFFQVVNRDAEDIAAEGGLGKLLEAVGVHGIKTGQVTVGVEVDRVAEVDADEGPTRDEPAPADVDEAKARYRQAFNGLLMAVQGASVVDPRVRMVRNLSQLVESRLLERRAVRDLAGQLRAHDKESYRHALGGAVIAVLIGSALGLEPRRLRILGEAALLRDTGKVRLSPDILHGRDKSAQHQTAYREHPTVGARILLGERAIEPTAAIVAWEHHAQLDLKGFPALATRKSLHAFTRIVAVASDYDRLTGGYPGLPVLSVWEAVGSLIQGVGSLYDPAAVRGFLRIMGCIPEGTPVQLLDGREGIVAGPGKKTWLCPEVAVLRDAQGQEIAPEIVTTDGLAPAGESVVNSFLYVTEADRTRLEALRNLE